MLSPCQAIQIEWSEWLSYAILRTTTSVVQRVRLTSPVSLRNGAPCWLNSSPQKSYFYFQIRRHPAFWDVNTVSSGAGYGQWRTTVRVIEDVWVMYETTWVVAGGKESLQRNQWWRWFIKFQLWRSRFRWISLGHSIKCVRGSFAIKNRNTL